MQKDEDSVISFIDDFRKKFHRMSFDDVAFPRGVKNLQKYIDAASVYKKATPIHVRGALIYNNLIKEKKLDNRYQAINNGDKVKFSYMKLPNPLHENVLAAPNGIPEEVDLDRFINYDLQFDKGYLEPIRTILDAVGWRTEKTQTLEDFFI